MRRRLKAVMVAAERLATWLELQPGMRVADFGAGDGEFAVATAARVGDAGLVYATEYDGARLPEIRRAATEAGRLVIIDFEPGGIMNWIGRPATADRHGGHGTPKETVLKEVTAAGFQPVRGPESWRGRTYAVLFKRP